MGATELTKGSGKAQRRKRGGSLRRYLPLALILAAGALAFFLPSALQVPVAQPPGQAEFAPPIPQSGESTSGDLEFGSGQTDATARVPLTKPDPNRPAYKRCVGQPARQTEDPGSPPCVQIYQGNNGGATTRGVTRDEIVAVLHFEARSGESEKYFVDCSEALVLSDTPADVTCKSYARFFNNRYQTYNRLARIYAYHGQTTGSNPETQLTQIETQKEPFALAVAPLTGGGAYAIGGGKRKIVTVGYEGLRRSNYAEYAPYVYGFMPDLEDEASLAAGFICRKLASRSARFHGDPKTQGQPRVFGFLADGEHFFTRDLIKSKVKAQCNLEVEHQVQTTNMTNALSTLRSNGVTTIIALAAQGQYVSATENANGMGWLPEWFVPGSKAPQGPDTNISARSYNQAAWGHAFGITFDYRRNEVPQQQWFQAFREGCPDCPVETVAQNAPYLYDALKMLFYGIQAAGPKLTPANIDKTLHAIRAYASIDPFGPAGYLTAGNYSFVKDAASLWWDPQGQAAGEGASGCYRLGRDGSRFRSGGWPEGDDELQKPDAPCQVSPK